MLEGPLQLPHCCYLALQLFPPNEFHDPIHLESTNGLDEFDDHMSETLIRWKGMMFRSNDNLQESPPQRKHYYPINLHLEYLYESFEGQSQSHIL
jgi:hypothetical protein